MGATHTVSHWRLAHVVVIAATIASTACGKDVGGSDTGRAADSAGPLGTGAASPAAGGAAGIDTAGGRVTASRSGSAIAPGPGQVPGTPGAVARDSAAAKAKSPRP